MKMANLFKVLRPKNSIFIFIILLKFEEIKINLRNALLYVIKHIYKQLDYRLLYC